MEYKIVNLNVNWGKSEKVLGQVNYYIVMVYICHFIPYFITLRGFENICFI